MLTILTIIIFILISFVLFCCIRIASRYDKQMDDIEQENFIKNHDE